MKVIQDTTIDTKIESVISAINTLISGCIVRIVPSHHKRISTDPVSFPSMSNTKQ